MTDTPTRDIVAYEAAESIATDLLHHIDTMYPRLWADAPGTARKSLRNVILNKGHQIFNALTAEYERGQRETDFQSRVQPWMMECFGPKIAGDCEERNHRFLEESLELVQACGCTASEAHQLVDYVYGRDVGERDQEVGGVMVTLAALCLAQNLNMHEAGWRELDRIWTKVEQIRAKQAAKPKHSPLPINSEKEGGAADVDASIASKSMWDTGQ